MIIFATLIIVKTRSGLFYTPPAIGYALLQVSFIDVDIKIVWCAFPIHTTIKLCSRKQKSRFEMKFKSATYRECMDSKIVILGFTMDGQDQTIFQIVSDFQIYCFAHSYEQEK